jgi:hypothetical protein
MGYQTVFTSFSGECNPVTSVIDNVERWKTYGGQTNRIIKTVPLCHHRKSRVTCDKPVYRQTTCATVLTKKCVKKLPKTIVNEFGNLLCRGCHYLQTLVEDTTTVRDSHQ